MPQVLRTTRAQVVAAVAVGLLVAVVGAPWGGSALSAMAGIAVGESTFLVLSFTTLWPMGPADTERNVGREDLSPLLDEVIVVLVAMLAMVSMVMLHLGETDGAAGQTLGAVLTLVGVFGAWACVHQTYAVHYAYRYYLASDGGVDFNTKKAPAFVDFLYLSYAVGMTYGVTDTTVTDRTIRGIVLRHSVLSFAFGMVIVGAGVNLVAGVFGLG